MSELVYEATKCPRFSREELPVRTPAAQLGFWRYVRTLVTTGCDAGLQIHASAEGLVGYRFFVRGENQAETGSAALEALLPLGYLWRRNSDKLFADGQSREAVRVVRQVHFRELVAQTPIFGEQNFVESQSAPDDKARKRLFDWHLDGSGVNTGERAFVPVVRPCRTSVVDFRRFHQELLARAPLRITITMRLVSTDDCEYDRVHVRPMAAALARLPGGGQGELDRYWRMNADLCMLDIEADSCGSELTALAAGDITAALLGDGNALEVAQGDAEAMLKNAGIELPHVTPDEFFLGFLPRMRRLFTLEEAAAVLCLPMADERGIPGIDARWEPPVSAFGQPCECKRHGGDGERVHIGQCQPEQAVLDGSASASRTHWHSVSPHSLCRHVLIAGTTGSGKTVTALGLLDQLMQLDVPFLVIEPVKNEYFGHLEKLARPKNMRIQRYQLGLEGLAGGILDPFPLRAEMSLPTHISYIKVCFQSAFMLSPIWTLILEQGLHSYYGEHQKICKQNGWGQQTVWSPMRGGVVHPSLPGFLRFFTDWFLPSHLRAASSALSTTSPKKLQEPKKESVSSPVSENSGKQQDGPPRTLTRPSDFLLNAVEVFQRRFNLFPQTPVGASMLTAQSILLDQIRQRDPDVQEAPARQVGLALKEHPFEALFRRPSASGVAGYVLELEKEPDNQNKALAASFILCSLYEYLQCHGGRHLKGDLPRHLLLLEEAHRLLPNSDSGGIDPETGARRADVVSIFADILAEVRAYGQAIAVVEQSPTRLAPDIVRNTNLKIVHRLVAREDRDAMASAMSCTEEQARYMTCLDTHEALVFSENQQQPVLTRILPPVLVEEAGDIGSQGEAS